MKTLISPTASKVLAGFALLAGLALMPAPALSQDVPGDDITRDLNSGPPVAGNTTPDPVPAPGPEAAPVTEAEPEAEGAVATPAAPEPAPLTLAERRALPFRVDLPAGAGIFPGRSGPEFDIYSVRLEGRGLVMIYLGARSQFPIYSGEQRERAGRRSIIVIESGQTLALEHLYRLRDGGELHVWVSAVSDEDRALASAIGQTIEPR